MIAIVALTDRLFMSYAKYLAWQSNQENRHEYIAPLIC